MKTAMQELLNDIKTSMPETFELIEQYFQIEDFYLEKEKQQIINASIETSNHGTDMAEKFAEIYYSETYN